MNRRKQRHFTPVFMGGVNGKFVVILQADDDGSFVVDIRNERQPGSFASREEARVHAESVTKEIAS